MSITKHLRALAHETRASIRLAGDFRSWWRLFRDIIRRRLTRVARVRDVTARRMVNLKGGVRIAYRLNRGDLQGLREVWMDEGYRPTFPTRGTIVVDLGANIGLSSVWLFHRLRCERIIAVEADAGNASLAGENFRLKSLPGEVIHAAVGPRDGWASFATSEESNMGHVIEGDAVAHDGAGREKVRMISMATVLGHLPAGRRIDLLKVDIEGGEGALFEGDLGWLDRVDGILIELHDDVTDTARVARAIEARGFRFIPAGSVYPKANSAFERIRDAV